MGYFESGPTSIKSAGKETVARQRLNSGCLAVSEVRTTSANPFETKRNFNAHRGCWGVCTGKVAEGKVLGANSLLVEERSPWGDCGNWRSGSFTQDYDPARQSETATTQLESEVPLLENVGAGPGKNLPIFGNDIPPFKS